MELVNSFRLHYFTHLCLCLIAIFLAFRESSEASGKGNEIERLATLPLARSAKSLTACANNFAADGTFRDIISRKGVDEATWVRALSEQNEWEQQDRYLSEFNEEVGKKLRAMIVQAVTTGRRQII